METKRGRPTVEVDGYLMVHEKLSRSGERQYWRCKYYSNPCPGRGVSDVNSEEVQLTVGHTRLPNVASPEVCGVGWDDAFVNVSRIAVASFAAFRKNRLLTAERKEAARRPEVHTGMLLDAALGGVPDEVHAALPRRSTVQRMLNRVREHTEGSSVDSRPENVRWTRFFKKTRDGKKFLRVDSRRSDPARKPYFIFASDSGIQQLRRERRWSFDGTFFTAPKQFLQMYVVGIIKRRAFIPCAFFLLPDKREETYMHAFTAFFTLPELLNAEPQHVMADFELAPINVIRELFVGVLVHHCQFHLAQNLIKHIQQDGLMLVYANDQCRSVIRCLLALAYLPMSDVIDGYDRIVQDLNQLINNDVIPQALVPKLNGLVSDYFEKNYIRRLNARGQLVEPVYPIGTWNMTDEQRFARKNMKLSQCLMHLQAEEEKTRQLLNTHRRHPAEPIRARFRAKQVSRAENLKVMIEEFIAMDPAQRDCMDHLRRVQHHLAL